MAIKKFYISERVRAGYPKDKRTGQHFSWGFDFRLDGTRYQQRGFVTKEDAENAITAIRKTAMDARNGIEQPREPDAKPFLIDLFQRKLNTMQVRTEKVRAKRVFDAFLNLIDGRLLMVEDLRSAHFQTYCEARIADGVSAATIRRELVPVVAALNSAGNFFAEMENYRPPRIPRPKISKRRKDKTVSRDEAVRIFAYLYAPRKEGEHERTATLRRTVGDIFLFQLLTGARPGEVAGLKRSDVDLENGSIRLIDQKNANTTGRVRYLKVKPPVREILTRRLAEPIGEFLFTKGGKLTGNHYEMLRAACDANNIPYGKHKWDGITFHRARHTALTLMQQSNQIDAKSMGAISGHSDATIALHYVHPHEDTVDRGLSVLAEKVSEILSKLPQSGELSTKTATANK